MLVDGDAAHHLFDHAQAIFQLIESREKYLFDDLQIPEVARRQIVGDEGYLVRKSLYFIAFGPCKFEYVGIFLMRHDARSGGVSIGQFDESEVLGVEQASIESHLRQGGGDRCQSRCDDALGFSPSHLGVNDIVVH